jgi:hypothetical protein
LNQALTVLNATEKTYDSPDRMPYWAVERLNTSLLDMSPLWGLVSNAKVGQNADKFDFLQSASLWLPGRAYSGLPDIYPETENMPANAFIMALGTLRFPSHLMMGHKVQNYQ